MRTQKNFTIEKDYKLTPWNYEDFSDTMTKQKEKKMPKTTSDFFKRRNQSEAKNSSCLQIFKQKKELRLIEK